MPTAHLPDQIEIFRPGRHIDDAGAVHEFSPADLAGMAAAYDPAQREAPLTVGHPEHNHPAYGQVAALAVNDAGRLVMNVRAVEPQFAEMVAARRFPKRSASFYPPGHPSNPKPGAWYLRHVAFLGAQQPAIAGLKDIQFAEDAASAAGTISFSEADSGRNHQEQQDMEKEAQEKLAAAEAKAKAEADARVAAEAKAADAEAKLAQFAEAARQTRHAGFVSFAEDQVKAGRLLPKDQAAAVAVLETLADAQPVEFAEAGATKKLAPADWLKGLIAAAKPVVSFGEFAPGGTGQGHPAKGLSDAEIDTRAKAYAAQQKVNYAEALTAVTTNFTV